MKKVCENSWNRRNITELTLQFEKIIGVMQFFWELKKFSENIKQLILASI